MTFELTPDARLSVSLDCDNGARPQSSSGGGGVVGGIWVVREQAWGPVMSGRRDRPAAAPSKHAEPASVALQRPMADNPHLFMHASHALGGGGPHP